MSASLFLLASLISVSLCHHIGFSLQLRGRGNIDTNANTFTLKGKGPTQIDKVKITPRDGIEYEVEEKIGSFAELHAWSTKNANALQGNITFGTHQQKDHSIQFAGAFFGESKGQRAYFSVLGLPTSGTGQFQGIDGRFSAAGVFDVLNATVSADADAAAASSNGGGVTPRADLDELLAQAELINDDELVSQLRAKKARRDARLLEAVQIKADLQAKSEKLQAVIQQREADDAASAAAEVAAEAEREARREAQRIARIEQAKREEEHENELKKLRDEERKQRRDRRVAAQKNADAPVSAPVAVSAPVTPTPVRDDSSVIGAGNGNGGGSHVEPLHPYTAPSTPQPHRSLDTSSSTSSTSQRQLPAVVLSPSTVVSPEREAELDAAEDAALVRARQRASERRSKKYQRLNDPNLPNAERVRLQAELARETSQKLDEMSKLKTDSDEDHQLFVQLESSMRRVIASKSPVGEEVLARAAEAEEVSSWIDKPDVDAAALPDHLSQKLLSRNVSKAAVAVLLADENAPLPTRAAAEAATSSATEGAGYNTIRVGVIGAGKNTCERHIPLIKLIDGVRVTHIANRTLESSQAAAKKCGIANACSVDEILNSNDIDAVIIGTWPNKHAEYSIAALGKNKHVLCEARMAMDGVEARTMLAASHEHPELVAQIVPSPYTLEFDAGIARYVKEHVGRLVFVRGVACTDSFAAVEATAPPTWRADRTLSGNNIMSMGIVYEALIRWVGRAATVSAFGSTVVAAQGDMPNVLALHGKLRKDDALFQLTFSDAAGLGGQNDIWIHGTKGTVHVDLASKRVYFGGKGDQTLREVTLELKSGPGWNVEKDFVDAIRGERVVTLTDFDTGVHYMSFTDAVWEAMRTQSIVVVV